MNPYPSSLLRGGDFPPHVTPDETTVPNPPLRTWRDMTRTVAHYERLEQIGEGTYGQVYRAKCLESGRVVAMKKMRIISRYVNGIPPQLIREIKILKQLRHPNLLRMVEVVTSKGAEHLDPDDPVPTSDQNSNKEEEDPEARARERFKGNLFLILEYVTHDLTGLMDVSYQFTPVQIKCIFQQLLQALKYMHDHKLVHRDIKSSNILIDSHFRLKLADFGLARSLEPPLLSQVDVHSAGVTKDLTNKVITLWYRAPEVLLGTVHYGCGVDIWSAGCILAELLMNKPLAAGKTELEQLNIVANVTGTPDNDTWEYLFSLKKTKNISREIPPIAKKWREADRKKSTLRDKLCTKRGIDEVAVNLLEKLLDWDPRKRLSATYALENKYFWTEPLVPNSPEELGRIEVAADGHFHEYQTKPIRREAKQVAERKKVECLEKGMTEAEASEEYDKVYRSIMKKVAEEGFKKTEYHKEDEKSRHRRSKGGEASGRRSEEADLSDDKKRKRRYRYESDEESDRKRRKKRRKDEESGRESRRRSSKERSKRTDEDRRERRSRNDDDDSRERRSRRYSNKDGDDASEGRRKRKKESRRHKSSKQERRRREHDRDDYYTYDESRRTRDIPPRDEFPLRDEYPPPRDVLRPIGGPPDDFMGGPNGPARWDGDRRAIGRGSRDLDRRGLPPRDTDRRPLRDVDDRPWNGDGPPRRAQDDWESRRRDYPRRDYDDRPRGDDRDGPPRGFNGPDDRGPRRDDFLPRRDGERWRDGPGERWREDRRVRDDFPPPRRGDDYDRGSSVDRGRRSYYDGDRRRR